MIGHEFTTLWHVDHARSLAIVQPSLLRNQIEAKRGKLEQMGRNVFGLEAGADLAERTIAAIEAFYHSLDVPTMFDGYETNKATAIDSVVAQLESHGYLELGENKAITPQKTREILESAIQ